MICVIDYGLGNVGSILNMLRRIGIEAYISSDSNEIEKADKLILPGVGSFDVGIQNLRNMNLITLLNEKVLRQNTPILGICLGMQLMTLSSEEGSEKGLGWINATTVKFSFQENIKVPHMGWNEVEVCKNSDLFEMESEDKDRFYFVHSYHVNCMNKEDILTSTNYYNQFASSFKRNNIYGVQFHPEKSHKFGIKLLEKFAIKC